MIGMKPALPMKTSKGRLASSQATNRRSAVQPLRQSFRAESGVGSSGSRALLSATQSVSAKQDNGA